jgi:ferric-dicitrate binding protein FerR (iron transport regulator)
MDADDEIRALLTEIRDLQREHLAEYRRVTGASLELQQQGIARGAQIGALYRRMVLVAGTLVALLLALLGYLLLRWAPYLFRH